MSELKAEQWLDYAGEPRPCYPKSEADKVIAGLERKVALLHRQCIMHKLRTEELRLIFWHSQRKWWESKDRGDTKPLFDYSEKERMARKRIVNLTRKLKDVRR